MATCADPVPLRIRNAEIEHIKYFPCLGSITASHSNGAEETLTDYRKAGQHSVSCTVYGN